MANSHRLTQSVLDAALEGLLQQRSQLEEQIQEVRRLLGQRGPGRPPAASKEAQATKKTGSGRKRRKMSPEAIERIREAQRRRWAAVRKANKAA